MVSWRRLTGVAGLAAGAIAAGAGALVIAEKIAVGRIKLRPDPAADESFGAVLGTELTVLADDGLPLHVQVSGPASAPATIIFSHGYALNADVWYYQRAAFDHRYRCVFYDQRSHGRSGRSDPELVSIDQLGADLHAVIEAVAPGDAPVILVGHSMGGMTIMALADQHPEMFGSKVIGVVLIATTAGAVDPLPWMPSVLRPAVRMAVPSMMTGASKGRIAGVVERSRQSASDLAFLGTRHLAFGDPGVSPTVVDFLERVIRSTPIDVVADFYVALVGHEKRHALKVLGNVPVLVLVGDKDRIVSPAMSEEIAAAIKGAVLVEVRDGGHVVILEHPDEVNAALADLVARALAKYLRDG
ncbi:MAG TPA: alpha/beta hydrolase [Streptosporangiaceae bacterium]|nr:alpha/beta hydrolase [Streptosporangiaceae bacterium]